jgi:hypothetical protein
MIVQLALETFKAFGMIEITDNVYKLSNWGKHQTLTNRKEYMKNYMKEYRSIGNVNNVNSLQGVNINTQEEEIELEVEERNKKKEDRGSNNNDLYFMDQLNKDVKKNTTFETLEKLIKNNFLTPKRDLTEVEARQLFDWVSEYPKEYLEHIISELCLISTDKRNFRYLKAVIIKAYDTWSDKPIETPQVKDEPKDVELDDVFAELKALKEKGKK